MAIALQVGWHGPNTASTSSHFPADKKRPWSEDSEKMLQLMMGQFERRTETLDLLGGSPTALQLLELEPEKPLPCGWEKCLDLKTGTVYYMNSISGTMTHNDPRKPSQLFSNSKSPTGETTKFNIRETRFLDGTTKLEQADLADFLSVRSQENSADKKFTSLVGQAKFEEPHLGASTKTVGSDIKLMDSLRRSEGKVGSPPSGADITDTGLELKLNLASNTSSCSIPAKEEKAFTCTSVESSLDWLDRKTVKRTIPSASNFLQSDCARARSSAVEAGAFGSAASTSSSHSFFSLQTTDESAGQSEGGGALCSEAESSKVERADQMMAIVGCSTCLMYVMMCKTDPRCPRCGSSVLVDFPCSSSKRPRVA